MNVSLTITFGRDEILAMCKEKCDSVKTPVPGNFEVSDYFGDVRAEFIPTVPAVDAEIASPAPLATANGEVIS